MADIVRNSAIELTTQSTNGNNIIITIAVVVLKEKSENARRLPFTFAESEAMIPVIVVPIFAPITIASAFSYVTSQSDTAAMIITSVAVLDCVRIQTNIPMRVKRRSPQNPSIA